MGNDENTAGSAADECSADGFRFLQNGEEVMMRDAEARRRLAVLEAMPGLWAGTRAQYDADNAAGKIPDGTVLIIDEEYGAGGGGE